MFFRIPINASYKVISFNYDTNLRNFKLEPSFIVVRSEELKSKYKLQLINPVWMKPFIKEKKTKIINRLFEFRKIRITLSVPPGF